MSDIHIPSGDITVAARDHGGDGPPILLLHGAGGNLLHWRDFPARLTAHHRVVSLDLRGHGLSGDGEFTLDAALDDIAAVAALRVRLPSRRRAFPERDASHRVERPPRMPRRHQH